ncbi:MAG: type II CRISPR-associated endonuclease Cas1 [Rickettsiales bacterium]|jgi:CRISPR-associated protein Cas1|nr:type II CRISPR-associated endonuclease Cas1 [Rickettsiales bacterium]
MGWRVLQLSKPCKLYVKNKQLLYESDETTATFPIEDLSVVVLETGFVQLTGSLLSEFAENGVVLFSCDSSHNPCGAFFPFHGHSRYAEITHVQIASSEPLKKRLWQSIVIQKIKNQADVLRLLGKSEAGVVSAIANRVQSGDSENTEAYAAQLYWKSLFDNFTRRDESNILNKALNYGYAIMRGCIARNVVGAGLMPCLGVHHNNQLNQFNLVDDLIEPFRPFVDFMVATTDFSNEENLTPQLKNQIISILLCNCDISGEKVSLLKSCEMTAESMAKSLREKDFHLLKLPIINGYPQIMHEVV